MLSPEATSGLGTKTKVSIDRSSLFFFFKEQNIHKKM